MADRQRVRVNILGLGLVEGEVQERKADGQAIVRPDGHKNGYMVKQSSLTFLDGEVEDGGEAEKQETEPPFFPEPQNGQQTQPNLKEGWLTSRQQGFPRPW